VEKEKPDELFGFTTDLSQASECNIHSWFVVNSRKSITIGG
jgi:hypothetical protein